MKALGLFILIILGIPILIGVTFAAGATRAVTDGSFMSAIADEVIEKSPEMVDEFFEAAKKPDAIDDPHHRAWIEAAAKVETTPRQIMDKTGISKWLKTEFAASFREVDQVFRGQLPAGEVALDMRPLKAALSSAEMSTYMRQLVSNLPACDEKGIAEWKAKVSSASGSKRWPACNPQVQEADEQVDKLIAARVAEIPDSRPLFETGEMPVPLDVSRSMSSVAWLLFLAPALIIALGALMAGSGTSGFLRYSGGTILAGGLVSLLLVSAAIGGLTGMLASDPASWGSGSDTEFWQSETGRIAAAQVRRTMEAVFVRMFEPVRTMSFGVGAVGLVLVILSFLGGRRKTESFPGPSPA